MRGKRGIHSHADSDPFFCSLFGYVAAGLLVVLVALGFRLYMSQQAPPKFMQLARLEIAHRGYSSMAPENTVAAFKMAMEQRVVAVEIDLMLSKDDVVVVAHDYKLDTFTDATGFISEKTWSELETVHVTRGGRTRLESIVPGVDDRLARFEDIVDAAARTGVQLVVELKTVAHQNVLIKKVAQILKDFRYVSSTVVTSFFPGMLLEFQRICPESYTLLLYSHTAFQSHCKNSPPEVRKALAWSIVCAAPEWFDSMASYLVEPLAKMSGAGAVGLDVQNPHLHDLASRSLSWGLHVVVWTVNSLSECEFVASIPGNQRGIVGIMTDCPGTYCASES